MTISKTIKLGMLITVLVTIAYICAFAVING